ncbi:MAG: peptidoglycan editing factor PgeF [Ktedonobacteraceae bacterium]|nr:peptidoglycan editing factor PgeF [Ktedonobacteraceae bacterium]
MIEKQLNDVCYLQFHHFSQFPELVHGIFTRQGGHSVAPYASLNTSTTLKAAQNGGDSIANVVRNRQLALQALDLPLHPCVTLWQVHGAAVEIFDNSETWRTDWAYESYYYQSWMPETIRKADALITQQRGITLALSFADCTPVLLYDPVKRVAALAHSGWRGTARGIVAATVAAMVRRFDCRPEQIHAGIGPAIGACCYEVSETVRQIFLGHAQFDEMPTDPQYRGIVRESAIFSTITLPDGRASLRLDLQATCYRQLLMTGIRPEHIETTDICTACRRDRFFSHRVEQGKTGRFPVFMALRAGT